MKQFTSKEKIAILDNILSEVNHNYPYPSTSNDFICCEVVRRYFSKMKYEGPYCLFSNNSEYFDFDINSLREFRNLKNKKSEFVLLLAFDENKYGIVDYFLFKGKNSLITCDDYFASKAINKIIEWHKKAYKIINIHNHPLSIAALPSYEDIAAFKDFNNNSKWIECEQKYEIKLPKDFCFFDFGIVTKHDYFSYKQNVNKINDIKKILMIYKNELDIKSSFSDSELFIWNPTNEFGVTAKGIFDGLKIYYKNRLI